MVSSTPGGRAARQAGGSAAQEEGSAANANDLRLIIPIQQQHPQQSAAANQEVLHATPPSSPLPREGGRDFVLIGGVASQQPRQQGQGQADGREHGGGGTNAELVDKVDFMGPADSMKALFRMPYTREPVSIAFHRMGETLIVDGALHELYEGPPSHHGQAAAGGASQPQQPPLAHSSTTTSSSSDSGDSSPPRGGIGTNSTSGHNKGGAHHQHTLALAPASFRLPPGPLHLPPPPRDHPHFVHFRLRELSLLMGTDVQVFRNARHPGGVSALFFDEEHGLELTTCLDGYLENVFAAIPELALTMTKRGYVRRCDLVRTEDIPLLQLGPGGPFLPSDPRGSAGAGGGGGDDPPTAASTSPADGGVASAANSSTEPSSSSSSSSSTASFRRPLFDPKMLDLNATTLLRFLKENCRAEGSTYLLYREEGGKSVSLYDVTALSKQRQKRWRWLLAMLSYRFAMRIYQQAPLFGRKRRQQLQMRHRRLLQTCLLLLQELSAAGGGAAAGFASGGGGQHESLCAAVQEQLADSYLGAAPKSVTHDETTTPSSTASSTDAVPPFPQPPASMPAVLPAPRQQHRKEDQTQQQHHHHHHHHQQQQQQHQQPPKEVDLNKAEQHLSHGISLLVPLLKAREEEEGDEGDDDDTPIVFGAFGAADHGASASARAEEDEKEKEAASSGGGGGAAALMVMEQMLGLRRKLVGTLRQLMDVHARRRDLPRLLETVRRAMHQISEAAALAGLHHDKQHPSKPRGRRQQQEEGRGPNEEEREVQARVRVWAAEAARDLWSVAAELARGLALRPHEWSAAADSAAMEGKEEGGGATSTTTTTTTAASLQEQGIELLAEMDDVLRRILKAPGYAHAASVPTPSSPAPVDTTTSRGSKKKKKPQQHHHHQGAASAMMPAAEEVRAALAHAPLRGLALVYLQPPGGAAYGKGDESKAATAANAAAPASHASLLVPGDPVQGLLVDATGPGQGHGGRGREARLLLVAAALAQARAVVGVVHGGQGQQQQQQDQEGRAQGLRRLADACNEVGGSLRATLVALSSEDGIANDESESAGGTATAASAAAVVAMPTPALLPRAHVLGTRASRGWFHAALALFGEAARASSSPSFGGDAAAAAADSVNIALVRLNLACVAKVAAACAPAVAAPSGGGDRDGDARGKEDWLKEGLEQGRRAHEALGEREADPRAWRLVAEEMAMLHLMLGLARRQAKQRAAAEEAGVVGPFETALGLYTQLAAEDAASAAVAGGASGGGGGGSGSMRMAGQAAAVHYNLGAFHAQTWMGSRDRRQARTKLAAAHTHYNHAFAHYYRECTAAAAASSSSASASVAAAAGTLRIILDLSQLYLSVDAAAGAAGGGDATCLMQALGCLLKAGPALRLVGEGSGRGKEVEERLGRTLLRLAKVAPGPEAQEQAKGMYRRLLLGRKEGGAMAGLVEELKAMYEVGSK